MKKKKKVTLKPRTREPKLLPDPPTSHPETGGSKGTTSCPAARRPSAASSTARVMAVQGWNQWSVVKKPTCQRRN